MGNSETTYVYQWRYNDFHSIDFASIEDAMAANHNQDYYKLYRRAIVVGPWEQIQTTGNGRCKHGKAKA